MNHYKNKGIKRIINAFGYSLDGLKAAYLSEAAFRQELLIFAILTSVAFLLDVSALERVFMISSLLAVLIVELINTAIETIIERISSDYHELSKKAKDLGAAAVLLSLINVAVIWLVVLL